MSMIKILAISSVAILGLVAGGSAAATQPTSWTTPIAPFRIAPHVYYVGTQGLAAYLITGSAGAALIDGTLARNAPLIERNIERVGAPLRSVTWLLADHAHNDHVGALAQIKRDTGARFAASAGDRLALERGAPRGDTDYDQSGYHWPPIAVDRVIGDGDRVSLGDIVLTAHLTPGHTPGCTSWDATVTDGGRPLRVLFLCSIEVAGNRLVGNRAYPAIAADFAATFAKLSRTKADIVLTSHPELADVLGREARAEAGDRDAFIDPGALPRIVERARRNFDAALAAERRKPQPRS